MSEFVRVQDKDTGHKFTVSAERADELGDAVTVLKDEDALDILGKPLPAETESGKPASKSTRRAAAGTANTEGN